jgi:predicted  nucleic acid-binding Zn-ribbon protein
MSFGGPGFILAIIAMSFIGWIITTAIRAKHGYPLENEWGGTTHKADNELKRQNDILERENVQLRGKIGRLEERMAVLERIATDAPNRLSAQIENLRD